MLISPKIIPRIFGGIGNQLFYYAVVCRLALVNHSANVITLKLRDFDGPMSGTLYRTSYNLLLENNFKIGEEIVTYVRIDDCISKITHYLKNEKEMLRIAANARIRSCAEYTWHHRLQLLTYARDFS